MKASYDDEISHSVVAAIDAAVAPEFASGDWRTVESEASEEARIMTDNVAAAGRDGIGEAAMAWGLHSSIGTATAAREFMRNA